jgi:hypothetical protein
MASPAFLTNRGDKPFFLACISAALLANLIRPSTEKVFLVELVFDGDMFFALAFGIGFADTFFVALDLGLVLLDTLFAVGFASTC